jgi:hypothetical protein
VEQGRPSLRSSDGGRNGTVTQLVDQETVTTNGDGTRASTGGATAHWKLQQGRHWRSSGMADSVRLLQLALSSTQIKEGSSVKARVWKKAGHDVREPRPAARCSKWGKGKVARGVGWGGGGMQHPSDLKESAGGAVERSEACVASRIRIKWLGN